MGLGCCLDLRIAAYSGVRSGKTSLEVPELYKPSNCRVPRSLRFLQGAGVCTVTFCWAGSLTAAAEGGRARAGQWRVGHISGARVERTVGVGDGRTRTGVPKVRLPLLEKRSCEKT